MHEIKIHTNERYYLNQGAERWCEEGRSTNNKTITGSDYCQWESWFSDDISSSIELSDPDRLSMLFVKRAAADAVLVHFRIGAPSNYSVEMTVDQAAERLLTQLGNYSSPLFSGNVTVTVDPTWGLSGEGSVTRESSPYLPHQVF